MASQKQPDTNPIDIAELKRLIEEANRAVAGAVANAGHGIRLCARIGSNLKKYKDIIGHGGWGAWLEENFSDFSTRTAVRWMKLGQKVDSGEFNPDDAKSLRQAYMMCDILPQPEENESSNAPAEINYLVHLDRLEASLRSIDVVKLPVPEQQQLRTRLRPIAELYTKLAAA
jgi:hypothetical protein